MTGKKNKKTSTVRQTGMWVVIMILFVGELFLSAWCRVQYVGTGYEISQEVQSQKDLIKLKNNLNIELASLKAPERIAKIAKNQLGLKTPTIDQVIIYHGN